MKLWQKNKLLIGIFETSERACVRGKEHFEKKIHRLKKFYFLSLCIVTPRLPMSVHKKFPPIWSSRFAGYR